MSISTRLYLLVFAAAAGLLIQAGIGHLKIGQVYESTNYGNVNTVPSILALDRAIAEFGELHGRVGLHVLTADDKGKAEIDKTLPTDRGHVEKALKEYEPLIADEQDRKLLEGDRAAWADYQKGIDETLELSRVNLFDEARESMVKHAPQMQKLTDALVGHMRYKEKLSKRVADEGQAQMRSATAMSVAVTLVVAVIVAGMGVLIIRSLMRQLGGEPGYVAEVVGRVAEGDLTVEIDTARSDNHSLLAAVRGMVGKLSGIIGEVRSAADALLAASVEVSSTAQTMTRAAASQASNVEQTSASVEEMSASIDQNAENARVTDGIAGQAARQANEGGEAVRSTVAAMKRIAEKIGIVDDIAYRTNLLALNAAIEAARAGEQGKGFAVVAAEVRKLAERSLGAAREIGETARESVGLAERAGHLLDEIVPGIDKTSDLVQEITASSVEQSSAAAQINGAMAQLSSITQQNASASEELAATSQELSSQAQQLQQLMAFFKVAGIGAAVDPPAPRSAPSPGGQPARAAARPMSENEFVAFGAGGARG